MLGGIFICLLFTLGQTEDKFPERTQLEQTYENPGVAFISLNLPHGEQSNRYIYQICPIEVCSLSKTELASCAKKGIPILISLTQSEDVEIYDANEVHKAYLGARGDPNKHPYDGLDIIVVNSTSERLLKFLLEIRSIKPGDGYTYFNELKANAKINRTNLLVTQEAAEKFTLEELIEMAQPPSELPDGTAAYADIAHDVEPPKAASDKGWSLVFFF
ncbi:hypothetical protein L0F63_002897 [Massospora cicadina]|nr:hypothetical protein L0F63_002897 [Massospora cicadina]